MMRTLMIAVTSAAVFTISPLVFGAQPDHGTADQAKAMLMKAVAAVKADETKALDTFNKGDGGFLDRDLYVFCFNASDGKLVANGKTIAWQGQQISEGPDRQDVRCGGL